MASFKHSVQLILYPQLYDGYHEYTRPNTTGGGNDPTNDDEPIDAYQVPIYKPELLGNAEFSRPVFGALTNLGGANPNGVASNSVALRTAAAPVGQWRLSYTNNLVGNEPNIAGGKLNLTGDTTTNSCSMAYTTVSGLQAGNSYRVLITIESAPAGNLEIGATGERGKWEQPNKDNSLARVGQCGGINGMVEGRADFIKADTGANYGNPLRTAITTPTRFYQNFIARDSAEVLQVTYQANGTSTDPVRIDIISVVASNTEYPDNPNNIYDNGVNAGPVNPVRSSTTFLDDGQVIVDLYKDQTIPLNLSVDEFTKVDEKIASYSKSFMIPATKHNNKIFSFYFDVTRSQDKDVFFFNPFAKTRAKVKEDTVLIFEGWMKLINVQIKKGQVSYNINLYSEPTTFCDYLKAGILADLNLDELGHDYTEPNIELSWDSTIGIPLSQPLNVNSPAYDPALGVNNTNAIKYPFINWSGYFQLMDPDNVFVGFKEHCFRPVMNCKYLLDKMFQATPFSYKSTFLNSPMFKKLFMDYNYSGEAYLQGTTFQMKNELEWAAASTGSWVDLVYPLLAEENPSGASVQHYDSITGRFTMQDDGNVYCGGQMRFYRDWFNLEGEVRSVLDKSANGGGISYPTTTPIKWYSTNWTSGIANCGALDGTNAPILLADQAQCGAGYSQNAYSMILNVQAGDVIYHQMRKTAGNAAGTIHQSTNAQVTEWNHDFLEDSYNNPEKNKIYFSVIGGVTTMAFLQQGLRAQMNQYDFWNGIKQMFNLVTMPDKTTENRLIIEPYYDVFLGNPDSKQVDWTELVDVSNIKIEPLNKIPKKTTFTYERDEDDFRATQYFNACGGYNYGSKTYEAGDQFFSLLTGEKKIEAKPFAPTIAAPITMLFPDWITSHIYTKTDEGYSWYENKPRILFDEGVFSNPITQTGTQLSYWTMAGFFVFYTYTTYGRMTHLSLIPTSSFTDDLNFGECPLVQPLGASPVNNLFNVYWKPYYDALYNPDAKIVKLKMRLTPKHLAEFEFYDTVLVKNREYRVNKIQYNSGLLASVELILIP